MDVHRDRTGWGQGVEDREEVEDREGVEDRKGVEDREGVEDRALLTCYTCAVTGPKIRPPEVRPKPPSWPSYAFLRCRNLALLLHSKSGGQR